MSVIANIDLPAIRVTLSLIEDRHNGYGTPVPFRRYVKKVNECQRSLGSRVVSELDSGAEGPGFKSQPQRCRVTVLGKLFTSIVPLFTKQRNWYQP